MKPPPRPQIDYERVPENDFVKGVIQDIEYEDAHEFKFEGNVKEAPGVRFKFALEGCKFAHYSRWMTFSYGKKTGLFLKYISALVENAEPDLDFDLDTLKGMRVKTLWATKNDYQGIETIRPDGAKLPRAAGPSETKNEDEEPIPF